MNWMMRAVLVVVIAIAGCSANPPDERVIETAGQDLYAALQAKEFDRALEMYSPDFFKGRPREPWRETLVQTQQKFGDIVKHELRRKQSSTRYSGMFYIYEYSVEYKSGKTWDTVTFFVPNEGGSVQVFGHQIKTAS